MATDLPVIANLTGAAVTEAQAKTFFTDERAAMAEMGDPMGKYGSIQNLTLSATVAGNALTIALKDRDAANPSAASPCSIPFRNVTLGTGTFAVTNVVAATSLAVPDTALLGTVNSIPFRLWIVGFDDAGTFRLGVVNCRDSSNNIMALKDDALYTSTSVGTGSDSAQVIYSGTGVTSKTMRVLGYAEWSTGLATAGSWSANPSKVQLYGPGVALPGTTVQVMRSQTGAVSSGTTVIPLDDTIPQITEGDQYMSQVITPTSSANALDIDVVWHGATNVAGTMAVTLHQDAVANALAVGFQNDQTGGTPLNISYSHRMLAATASAMTLRVRAGQQTANTTTFNGFSGLRRYGGVMASSLTVREMMG